MLFVSDDSRTVRAARTRRDFLIITADDFGACESVNEAVELAAHRGVLTAASLMVGGPAFADAVHRARRLPQLRVGLHIVLVDGSAILERAQIPLLVDASGKFGKRMVIDAFRFVFSASMRQQLSAEIRAQFEAFVATGLQLDHVNAHKHFHVHPMLLRIILEVGREFGMQAIRWPREPWLANEHASQIGQAMQYAGLSPWLTLMRRQIDRAGLLHNDWMFGMAASGHMDTRALLCILQYLPSGITEIYSHPATCSDDSRRELAALINPGVRATIRSAFIARGGYSDALKWQRART